MPRKIADAQKRRRPDLARKLRQFETEVRERGFRITRDIIASDIGVARSAVSSWFAGKQTPRQTHLEELAKVFAAGDEQLRARYRGDLFEAAGVPPDLSGARDPMARARELTGNINIGYSRYEVSTEAFFQTLLSAFGEFCAFRFTIEPAAFKDLTNEVATGKIDIGANFFVTPDRLQRLRFIDTPIMIGLNALAFANLKRTIQSEVSSPLNVDEIQPIMNPGQTVYQYAQNVLGISHLKIIQKDYEPRSLADELQSRSEQWQSGMPVPVVITDEVMALRIQAELAGRIFGPGGRIELLEKLGPPMLLLGKDKPKWARRGALDIAARPRYSLSLCVKRLPADEWHQYVVDAWNMFLVGNPEFLADEYEKVCVGLQQHSLALERAVGTLAAAEIRWTPQPGEGGATLHDMLVGQSADLVKGWVINENATDLWRPAVAQAAKKVWKEDRLTRKWETAQ